VHPAEGSKGRLSRSTDPENFANAILDKVKAVE
jgi:hypothetical protein